MYNENSELLCENRSECCNFWDTEEALVESASLCSNLRAKCHEYLNSLTISELTELRRHTSYRLKRVALDFQQAEDLVQDAILAVWIGCACATRGRHPAERHLLNKTTFVWYLRGVLNSLVEAKSRGRGPQCINLPQHTRSTQDEEHGEPAIVGTFRPENDAVLQDFFREFFRMLRRRVPKHLTPLVEAWAAESQTADKIPLASGCRRHRYELRRIAQRVLIELDKDNG